MERNTSAATVLRTALSAACREELITRNVATLVEPPLDFLAAARKDPLYAAFVLAIALGFRRGEIVGLRWENVDLAKREIRVRTQIQRVGKEAYEDDPKGRRRRKQTLPLPAICIAPLRWQRLRQADQGARVGEKWQETGYVFTIRTGRPVEPMNLYRSFMRVLPCSWVGRAVVGSRDPETPGMAFMRLPLMVLATWPPGVSLRLGR